MRVRTSIAFAALALILSVSLVLMTYALTRRYLLSKRETLATHQAVVDARTAAAFLQDRTADPTVILASLSSATGAHPVLRLDRRWFAASIDAGRDAIPPALRTLQGSQTQRQRVTIGGQPAVIVAVPIGPDVGVYYEVFTLTELEATLRTLAIILAIAAAITTVSGATVGLFASRRILRPIDAMAHTAVDIASGNHDRRLVTSDPDLAPFVHAFNDMVDTLQERVDHEARFASDVSHELRTPLTAIRSAIDVLGRRVDDRSRPALDILRRQTERFERLVLDLLEISRFDAGSASLVLEDTDPARFVEGVLRRTGHAEVPVAVDPSAPRSARFDPRRIDRVLTNLLENADHYANGATQVLVVGTVDGLEIAVDDAGPGIPPGDRDIVFERFNRGESSRASSAPGTGLGLAIAAAHCELHGGRLTVADSPTGGARFVIELPLDISTGSSE